MRSWDCLLALQQRLLQPRAFLLLALVLALQARVGISPSTREVSSSSEFYLALKDKDALVLLVNGDISLDATDFDAPLLIDRGVLINSVGDTDEDFFRIDFNFLQTRAIILPGVVIEFRHLNLQNTRYGQNYNLDFFGYSPNGTLFLNNSMGEQPSCAPFNLQRIRELLPPTDTPPGFESQNVDVIPHHCIRGSCFASVLNHHNYSILGRIGSVDGHWNEGGYLILKRNVLKACKSFVSKECISNASVDACVVNAINAYIADRSAFTDDLAPAIPSASGNICRPSTWAAVSVLSTVIGGFWALVLTSHAVVSLSAWLYGHYKRFPANAAARATLDSSTQAARMELCNAERLVIMTGKKREELTDVSDNSDVSPNEVALNGIEVNSNDQGSGSNGSGSSSGLGSNRRDSIARSPPAQGRDTTTTGKRNSRTEVEEVIDDGIDFIGNNYMPIRNLVPHRGSDTSSNPSGSASTSDPQARRDEFTSQRHGIIKQPRMQRVHGYDDTGSKFYIEVSNTLLGQGCFGRVWKGRWSGQDVAVKQMEHSPEVADNVSNEVAIMLKIKHKNVVCALQYVNFTLVARYKRNASVMGKRKATSAKGVDGVPAPSSMNSSTTMTQSGSDSREGGASGSGSGGNSSGVGNGSGSGSGGNSNNSGNSSQTNSSGKAAGEASTSNSNSSFNNQAMGPEEESSCSTWIVLELCDKGTLASATQEGMFHTDDRSQLHSILLRLLEVSEGCSYVHAQGICHGDLKNSNILLRSAETDPLGVVAKVADFGLSRALAEDQTHLSTRTMGTVSHMAPELLRSGKLSPAADVYAFGICGYADLIP
eukprot:gene9856-7747_t